MPNESIEDKELIRQVKSLPKDFLDELRNEVKQNREQINKRKRFFKIVTPLAAACIVAIFYVSFFIEFANYSKFYQASNKIQNNILLPDNSKISLDANTSIDVKYYKTKRVVELSTGKAIFDITSNKEQPFIINANKINIEVLGTKFEVINFDEQIAVNVLEGRVKVSAKDGKEISIVTTNQSLNLDKNANKISLKDENINDKLLWIQGKYNFNQTRLDKVFDEFSKHLDINIVFESQKAKYYPISGSFDVKHFDNFLKVLPKIHRVKVIKQDNMIVIK